MDIESEITRLQAEGMAVQTLFVGLCHGIMGLDHRNRSVVEDAFSYAESVSEAASFKMASEENGAYLTG